MYRIALLLSLIFISSCGPIYETRRSYVAPKTQAGLKCINSCSMNKHSCNSQCNSERHICLVLEENRARTDYEAYMRTHCSEITSTQAIRSNVPHNTIGTQFSSKSIKCQEMRGPESFRHTYACDTSFQSCTEGCARIHDECYVSCGGQVNIYQECVALCNRG